MVVDTAKLADFPADGHAFEDFILEDQIARVVAFGEEEVFVERLGANGVMKDEILHGFQSEFAGGDRGETLDPVSDGQLFRYGFGLLVHKETSKFKDGLLDYNAARTRIVDGRCSEDIERRPSTK